MLLFTAQSCDVTLDIGDKSGVGVEAHAGFMIGDFQCQRQGTQHSHSTIYCSSRSDVVLDRADAVNLASNDVAGL